MKSNKLNWSLFFGTEFNGTERWEKNGKLTETKNEKQTKLKALRNERNERKYNEKREREKRKEEN